VTRYRALLVGNSRFPADPDNLQTLVGPPNDVDQLARSLADQESGLFSPDEITILTDRRSGEVLIELDKFFGRARRDDVLLFYYSGHGRLDLHNVLYLCTLDTQTDLLGSTTVNSARVREFVDRTAATNTVIMLDCCHSGAYKGADIARALRNPKSYVLTSCRQDDLANDASAVGRTSVFTEQVVRGLVLASATGPPFDHLTIEDLFGYVRDGLATRGKQVPQFITRGDGDLPIARRRAMPERDARGRSGLQVSETQLHLSEVDPDDVLPVERVYVTARRADGRPARWAARTSAAWVSLTQRMYPDRLEIGLHPDRGAGRANIEIRNEETGEVVTVRVVMRLRTVPLWSPDPHDVPARQAMPGVAPSPRSTVYGSPGSPPGAELDPGQTPYEIYPGVSWTSPALTRGSFTRVARSELGSLSVLGRGGTSQVYRVDKELVALPGRLAFKELLPGLDHPDTRGTTWVHSMRRAVALRDAMSPKERAELDAVTLWPLAVVEDRGEDVGVLMRLLPDAFYIETTKGHRPFELHYLCVSPKQAEAIGFDRSRAPADNDLVRLALMAHLAYAIEIIHRPRGWQRLVFGDLNMRNVALATDPPRVLLMGCEQVANVADSTRVQLHSPHFVPPEMQERLQELQDQISDVYKLGLCVIRGLASGRGALQLIDPASPLIRPGLLDPTGVTLLERAVGADRHRRPTAEAVKDYLVDRIVRLVEMRLQAGGQSVRPDQIPALLNLPPKTV